MRELRLVLLGLAAVMALLLGVMFLMRALNPHPAQISEVATLADEPRIAAPGVGGTGEAAPLPSAGASASARAAIDRAIADAPPYARFFDRMRLLFPSDYETIMNGLAAASGGGEIDVDRITGLADAALRRQHGKLQALSSDAALNQVFAADLQAMQALAQRDTHLCVSYLFHATGSGFLDFAADHRDVVASIALSALDAMNSGRMDATRRAPPSDADLQDFDRALVARGLSRPEIEVLLDAKAADPPIADDAMCKAGIAYLDAMANLPEDERSRLYALAVGLKS